MAGMLSASLPRTVNARGCLSSAQPQVLQRWLLMVTLVDGLYLYASAKVWAPVLRLWVAGDMLLVLNVLQKLVLIFTYNQY